MKKTGKKPEVLRTVLTMKGAAALSFIDSGLAPYNEERAEWDMEGFNEFWACFENTCLTLQQERLARLAMEQREKGLQQPRVMLHDQPADKPDEAEKRVEAELKPRPARILTPAFLRGLVTRALFGFALGILASFALKLLLVF